MTSVPEDRRVLQAGQAVITMTAAAGAGILGAEVVTTAVGTVAVEAGIVEVTAVVGIAAAETAEAGKGKEMECSKAI